MRPHSDYIHRIAQSWYELYYPEGIPFSTLTPEETMPWEMDVARMLDAVQRAGLVVVESSDGR